LSYFVETGSAISRVHNDDVEGMGEVTWEWLVSGLRGVRLGPFKAGVPMQLVRPAEMAALAVDTLSKIDISIATDSRNSANGTIYRDPSSVRGVRKESIQRPSR
jgi:hypothetical protein